MKKAMTAELKNHLSRYLDHVRQGGEVLVFDRTRPIARIVPLQAAAARGGDEAWLLRLERGGVVRRGKGGVPAALRRGKPLKLRKSLLADVLAERRTGW